MPAYDFHLTPEAVWFVLTAVATVLLQAFQGAPPTDYRTWLIGLGAAAVRAALGAILDLSTKAEAP